MAKGSTLLLVHGAWCGGWIWEPVVEVLRKRGVAVEVIEQLPSAGPDAAELGDLQGDVECVRARLATLGDAVVICGHSYAGVVMAELGAHPAIARSIYLSAFWPAQGQSLLDLVGGRPPDWVDARDDGSLAITDDAARAHEVLFGDLSADRAARVHERLVRQSAASFLAPVGATAAAHPATYVLCTEDQAVPLALQEAMAATADDVVRLQSAHFAQLSHADALAGLLASAVTNAASSAASWPAV